MKYNYTNRTIIMKVCYKFLKRNKYDTESGDNEGRLSDTISQAVENNLLLSAAL